MNKIAGNLRHAGAAEIAQQPENDEDDNNQIEHVQSPFHQHQPRPANTSHAASAATFCSARHDPDTARPSAATITRRSCSGLVQGRRRDVVEIPFAKERACQPAAGRGIFDDAAKEPALERVDANVIVRDALGVDQASHDDADPAQVVSRRSIVLGSRRPPTAGRTAFTERHQPGQVPRRRFARCRSRHGRAAAIPRSTGRSSRILRLSTTRGATCRAGHQDRTGPPGLHGKADSGARGF